MEDVYSIPLAQLCKEFSLEIVYAPDTFEDIMITTPEISRPGLALAGFFEVFDAARIQIIGYAERRYLESLPPEQRRQRILDYINAQPIAVVFSTKGEVFEDMMKAAIDKGVPLLRSSDARITGLRTSSGFHRGLLQPSAERRISVLLLSSSLLLRERAR